MISCEAIKLEIQSNNNQIIRPMKNLSFIAVIALMMMGGMTMKAQDYHPIVEDGKQWNVLFSYPWNPPEPQHKYTDIYKIEGDTLVKSSLVDLPLLMNSSCMIFQWKLGIPFACVILGILNVVWSLSKREKSSLMESHDNKSCWNILLVMVNRKYGLKA